MKDVNGKIQFNGKEFPLVFNLNVMERIQEEYGSISAWGDLAYRDEPDVKAVLFGLTEMVNEGIDIQNEQNGTQEAFLTKKQVGRMLTDYGLADATAVMGSTMSASTQSAEKN